MAFHLKKNDKLLIDSNIISYLADKESPYNQTVVNHFYAR
jgi:hypothetical protein